MGFIITCVLIAVSFIKWYERKTTENLEKSRKRTEESDRRRQELHDTLKAPDEHDLHLNF